MKMTKVISADKIKAFLFMLIIFFLLTGFNQEGDPSKRECLDCHDDIKSALQEKHPHYPVEAKQCDACHDAETFGFVEEGRGLCTVCHRDYAGEAEGKGIHEVIQDCTNCHNPHASANPTLLIDRIPSLCFSCHDNALDEKKPLSVHMPYEEGECLSCHKPHISPHRPLLIEQPWTLCGACHDYAEADFKKTHLYLLKEGVDCLTCHKGHISSNRKLVLDRSHSPFAEGMCDGCHELSGEGEPAVLTADGVTLCIQCHPGIEENLKSPFIHYPADEDCRSCHDPHGTVNRANLLETDPDLCARCHAELMVQENRGQIHSPFSDGECTGCHNPHGSANSGILSINEKELCLQCHTQISERLQNSHPHTAVLQGCIACHEPHKGKIASLLKDEGEVLCFRCHDSRPKNISRFVHYPFREGNCSTCHLPHGGNSNANLTKDLEPLCMMCHPKGHKNFPHPTGVKPSADQEIRPGSKLPLSSEGKVICTTCHEPHCEDIVFLLRTDIIGGALCYQCHQR